MALTKNLTICKNQLVKLKKYNCFKVIYLKWFDLSCSLNDVCPSFEIKFRNKSVLVYIYVETLHFFLSFICTIKKHTSFLVYSTWTIDRLFVFLKYRCNSNFTQFKISKAIRLPNTFLNIENHTVEYLLTVNPSFDSR